MVFTDPDLKDVIKTLNNNKDLINYLKNKQFLLTRQMLYGTYPAQEIADGEYDVAIASDNANTIEDIAITLLAHKEEIKENDVWYLCSNRVAFSELATDLGISDDYFEMEVYKTIMYTFKYCYTSSFFQNNKASFFPTYDFETIQNSGYLAAYLDALMKEVDKIDYTLSEAKKYQNFDEIPFDYINYLSQLLGFEKATINADESIELKYRELLKNIIDIYRIKGSNYSFELLFDLLGYNITIEEFFFDRRLYYSSSASNAYTDSTDKSNYLFYLTTEKPEDNKLSITVTENVTLRDYSTQYSVFDFAELADKYGEEAVLGYSPVDKNGDEYTGKVFKYFKTNVIYYTVGTENGNPTTAQLNQINKILSFLTPAYVVKATTVNAASTLSDSKPSENMIFFDDNRTKTIAEGEKTIIEKLEDKYGEDFEAVETDVREYPIMLDSEKRNDASYDSENKSLDEQSKYTIYNNTGTLYVIHDNSYFTGNSSVASENFTNVTEYRNSINTNTYKPKIHMNFVAKLSIGNNYNWESNKPENFIEIKEENKALSLKRDIGYTDLSIEDYLDSLPLNYSESLFIVLNKIATLRLSDYVSGTENFEIDNYKIRYYATTTINLADTLNDCIDPERIFDEDKFNTLELGDNVLLSDGKSLCVYQYGYTPKINSKYESSFITKLTPLQTLYVTRNQPVYINVDESNQVVANTLDELYSYVNAASVTGTPYYRSSLIPKFFYSKSENIWYYPTKKAEVFTYISETYKKTYAINSSLGFQKDFNLIPIITLSEGTYYYEGVSGTLDEVIASDEFSEFYKQKKYFYVRNRDNTRESKLYRFSKNIGEPYVYSAKDETLYYINNNSATKLEHFFGNLVVKDNSAYIYYYDDSWQGYSEINDEASFIFYNSPHKVQWKYLGINKAISRPIKALTDTKFPEYREAIIQEIIYSTLDFYAKEHKQAIINAFNVRPYEEDGSIGNMQLKNIGAVIQTFVDSSTYSYSVDSPISYLENNLLSLEDNGEKILKDVDNYGKVNNDFYPFYNLLVNLKNGTLEDYLKQYFYDKLLSLYREAYLKDDNAEARSTQVDDTLDYTLYERLNGRINRINKPSTLRQSRNGKKVYTAEYTVVDSKTIKIPYDSNFGYESVESSSWNSGSESYNTDTISNTYKKDIKNITLRYNYKSAFIENVNYAKVKPKVTISTKDGVNVPTAITSAGYITITGDFPEDLTDGTVVINNTPQTLFDNKINQNTSSYLKQDEFCSFGDDRRLTFEEDIKTTPEVEANADGSYTLVIDKIEPDTVTDIDLETKFTKFEVPLKRLFVSAKVTDLNPQASGYTVVNFNNIKVTATFALTNLEATLK